MLRKYKIHFLILFLQIISPGISNAGVLRDSISMFEEQPGTDVRHLPQKYSNFKVDINSTVNISFSTSVLNSSNLYSDLTHSNISLDARANKIQNLISGMNTWLQGLAQGWEITKKLTTATKGKEFDKLVEESNDKYSLFYSGVDDYEKALKEMPGGEERVNVIEGILNPALALGPVKGLPKIAALFNSELEWLNSQIKDIDRQALENGNILGIKMNANFIHQGQTIPMHLPGYDNYASGIPEPYEKLRFEPNEQDKKALSEINDKATKLADSLRESKSVQEGLVLYGKQVLSENYYIMKNATDELYASIKDLQSIDWDAKKKLVENESQANMSTLKVESANEYKTIISSLTYLITSQSNLTTQLNKLSSSMDQIKNNLESVNNLRQQNNATEESVA